MRLTRNNATDTNPDLRGCKHYFTIENAPAIVLEAMDEMLLKAGWKNDGCPCYDDGFGCGWWIDLSEIADFKAAYKEAKAGVRGYMARRAIKAHFDTQVTDIEAAHAEALVMDATFEENLVFLASPDMADIWHKHTDTLKARILAAAHSKALEMDANYASANQMAHEFLNEPAPAEKAQGK